MIAKYHSYLENLLRLRHEDNKVSQDCQNALMAVGAVNETLLGDDLFVDHYPGIIQEITERLEGFSEYDQPSLIELNKQYASQSKTLASIWNDVESLEEFFKRIEFFEGITAEIEKIKKRLSSLPNIVAIQESHSWIVVMLGERTRLESVLKDISKLDDLLTQYGIYQAIVNELQKCKQKIKKAGNIDKINEYYDWIMTILGKCDQLKRVREDIATMEDLLRKYPLYQGIVNKLQRSKSEITVAKTIKRIEEHHDWVIAIIKQSTRLDDVTFSLRIFKSFIKKHEQIFNRNEWITELENRSSNVEDSDEILVLHKDACKRIKIMKSIEKLMTTWTVSESYFFRIGYGVKHSHRDLHRMRKVISEHENNNDLNVEQVNEMEEKLSRKFRFIKKIKDRPYPRLNRTPFPNRKRNVISKHKDINNLDVKQLIALRGELWGTIGCSKGIKEKAYPHLNHIPLPNFWVEIGNVLKIPVNILLYVFVWPILFFLKKVKISCNIRKSVLKW